MRDRIERFLKLANENEQVCDAVVLVVVGLVCAVIAAAHVWIFG